MIRILAPHSLRLAGSCVAITICAAAAPQLVAAQRFPATADSALALHVLNRLTFGPRPGDVGRVLQTGVDTWIGQQLAADSALDTAAVSALGDCRIFVEPLWDAVATLSGRESFPYMSNGMLRTASIIGAGVTVVARDSAAKISSPSAGMYLANGQLHACRLTRAEASDKQLLEVMTDFWENHFSLHGAKVPVRGMVLEYDRGVIRPNALGKFRDLLGAVAHSPAMLTYLDNAVNSADSTRTTLAPYQPPALPNVRPPRVFERPGLNENYARELLELHTMGVDGGYSQSDVIDVARALTGWSHSVAVPGGDEIAQLLALSGLRGFVDDPTVAFVFDAGRHDAEAKVVLGQTLRAGRGLADGEDVLDIISRHPSTARFIARKLAVRFVSDTPPDALVERAAATFTRTDGDIRQVLYTIFTSAEFRSPDVYGAKVKSPLEFVLSLRRALAAPPDSAAESIDLLLRLNQAPLGRFSPDGWPETGSAWMNVGAMSTRLDIVTLAARNSLPSIPLEQWPEWQSLSTQMFEAQLAGVIRSLLNGRVSEDTRTALAALRPSAAMPGTAEQRRQDMRDLIAIALSSPEFQHR